MSAGGQGVTEDASGNLYVMVANGDTTAQNGGTSFGEAFVKLTPSLSVLDWFIDDNFVGNNDYDYDLG